MPREVSIVLSEKFQDQHAHNDKNVHDAVGYLSCWASHNPRYQKATIYGSGQGNLIASYRDKDGNVTYNIAAEPRDDGSFSYHS